jgi:hypothetical protein
MLVGAEFTGFDDPWPRGEDRFAGTDVQLLDPSVVDRPE